MNWQSLFLVKMEMRNRFLSRRIRTLKGGYVASWLKLVVLLIMVDWVFYQKGENQKISILYIHSVFDELW